VRVCTGSHSRLTCGDVCGNGPSLPPSLPVSLFPSRAFPSALSNVGGRDAGKVGGGVSEKRKRWTADEEEALREGVKLHGEGFWKQIKESSQALQNRTAVSGSHLLCVCVMWGCCVRVLCVCVVCVCCVRVLCKNVVCVCYVRVLCVYVM